MKKPVKFLYFRVSTPSEIWFCDDIILKMNIEDWVEEHHRVTVRRVYMTRERFEELREI